MIARRRHRIMFAALASVAMAATLAGPVFIFTRAIPRPARVWLKDAVIDLGIIHPGDTGHADFIVLSSLAPGVTIRPYTSPMRGFAFGEFDRYVSASSPATFRVYWNLGREDPRIGPVKWQLTIATDDSECPVLPISLIGTIVPE